MKHALFALISVVFAVSTVPAQAAERTWPPNQVDSWIMSYDQIMQLTPEHRREYLTELRNIIVDFEKNSEAGLPQKEAMNLRQLIDDLLLPSAYAAGKCLPGEEFFARHCYLHKQKRRLPGYTCSENSDGTYDCDRLFNKLPPGIEMKEPVKKKRASPSVEAPVRQTPSAKMREEAPARPDVPIFPAGPADEGGAKIVWPTVNEAGKGDKLQVRRRSAVAAQPANRAQAEQQPVETQPAKTQPAKKQPVKKQQAARSAQAAQPAPKAPEKEKAPAAKKTADVSCHPKLKTCEKRSMYRKAFYQKKRPCIYSGNVSSYPGDPQKGKCTAVRDFEGKGKKCRPGHVICNPLVFGFASDRQGNLDQPICVRDGNEATAECNRRAPKDNLNKLFEKGFNGLKEAFDSYISALKKICDEDEASAQFHCEECNITKERLFKLQEKFRGNLCEQLSPSQPDESEGAKSTR